MYLHIDLPWFMGYGGVYEFMKNKYKTKKKLLLEIKVAILQ